MRKASKKGQITLFIIIGILILFIVLTYLYLTTRTAEESGAAQIEVTSELATYIAPINKYVEACILDLGAEAFKELGSHGGYIDMQDYDLTQRHFNLSQTLYESDALYTFPLTQSNPVPYWFYLASKTDKCSNCRLETQKPKIVDIEYQVNRYIVRHLYSCLAGFEPFVKQGLRFTSPDPLVNTTITQSNIFINVTLPIQATKEGVVLEFAEFVVDLNLDFSNIYELAALISYYQYQTLRLEQVLMNLISAYSGPDRDKLPPLGWMDLGAHKTTWDINNVKEKLRNDVFAANIALVQINQTFGATKVYVNQTINQIPYDTFFWEIFNTSEFENISVSFIYDPIWDFYLDITPRTRRTLKPTMHKQIFPFAIAPSMQANTYEFFYDIALPVLVVLRSHDPFYNEKGYTFVFALEANVRDNRDFKEINQGKSSFSYDYSTVSTVETSIDVTSADCVESQTGKWGCPLSNKYYDNFTYCNLKCIKGKTIVEKKKPKKSLFCDYEQWNAGSFKFNVIDAKTKEPMDEVSVGYRCGNHRECSMGEIRNGTLDMSFPFCFGSGILQLEKSFYNTIRLDNVSSMFDDRVIFNFEMEPFQDKEVVVKYIDIIGYRPGIRLGKRGAFLVKESLKPGENETPKDDYTRAAEMYIYFRDIEVEEVYEDFAVRDTVITNLRRVNRMMLTNRVAIRLEYGLETYDKFIDEFGPLSINLNYQYSSTINSTESILEYREKAKPIDENDSVTLIVTRIKFYDWEPEIPTPILMVTTANTTILKIMPDEYEVRILYTDKAGVTIPPAGVLPEINFTPALLGGIELTKQTGIFNITRDELYTHDTIEFYFYRSKDPEFALDLNELGKGQAYSKMYLLYFKPEFKE